MRRLALPLRSFSWCRWRILVIQCIAIPLRLRVSLVPCLDRLDRCVLGRNPGTSLREQSARHIARRLMNETAAPSRMRTRRRAVVNVWNRTWMRVTLLSRHSRGSDRPASARQSPHFSSALFSISSINSAAAPMEKAKHWNPVRHTL